MLSIPRKTNITRTANAAGSTCEIRMCWTPGMPVWFCQGSHCALGTTKVKILTHVSVLFNFYPILFFWRVILFLGLFHNFLWVFQVNYKIVFIFFYFHFDEGWAWGRSTGYKEELTEDAMHVPWQNTGRMHAVQNETGLGNAQDSATLFKDVFAGLLTASQTTPQRKYSIWDGKYYWLW